ncbi:hypothetical protein LCGC14_2627960, partial [marine sediment metagenome]
FMLKYSPQEEMHPAMRAMAEILGVWAGVILGTLGIDEFVRAVAAEGVPISRRYPTPLLRQPVFRDAGYGDLPCPVAERLADELFTLLVHPTLTAADLDDVVTAIRKVADRYERRINESRLRDR